jgi:hypothetical protein
VAARASSVFKYAGIPGTFLTDDSAVEQDLGDGHSVLPVMISYHTPAISPSAIWTASCRTTGPRTASNRILSLNLQLANKTIDAYDSIPCLRGTSSIRTLPAIANLPQNARSPDYAMPVSCCKPRSIIDAL